MSRDWCMDPPPPPWRQLKVDHQRRLLVAPNSNLNFRRHFLKTWENLFFALAGSCSIAKCCIIYTQKSGQILLYKKFTKYSFVLREDSLIRVKQLNIQLKNLFWYLTRIFCANILLFFLGLPYELTNVWQQYPWIFGEPLCKVRALISEM